MDPVARLGLAIAAVLVAAKVGGDLATRFKQPSVLGELVAGIVLGCVPLRFVEELRADSSLDMLARLGAVILLFEVGLESTVAEVLQVGASSMRVAVLGVVGTFGAGFAAASVALPHATGLVRSFLAASLTATSIGISARVLKDAGASRTREARAILGASVIDDILGLVLLAVLGGAVAQTGGSLGLRQGAWLLGKTLCFLAVALALGPRLSRTIFRTTARLRTSGALLAVGLAFCFLLAWASSAIGLAPIVGGFTAGLILEESHSAHFVARGERPLSDLVGPISSWLVPIFFVVMGVRADLRAAGQATTLVLLALLAVAAIAGKLACALGAPPRSDRIAVALGMLPRGEVTLVFASVGLSAHVLDPAQYSALVGVVVLTALATPTALRWRLGRAAANAPSETKPSGGAAPEVLP
jgi:Kef-type K+ transport system membrane component KefB